MAQKNTKRNLLTIPDHDPKTKKWQENRVFGTEPVKRRDKKKTVVIPERPVAHVLELKAPRVDYLDLFEKSTALSLGANMSVIRSWMALEGWPELPERISVIDFANVSARFMLPRYAWPFFDKASRVKAVEWISAQAKRLAPEVLKDREPTPAAPLASWQVSELAYLYEPKQLLGRTA